MRTAASLRAAVARDWPLRVDVGEEAANRRAVELPRAREFARLTPVRQATWLEKLRQVAFVGAHGVRATRCDSGAETGGSALR